MHFVFLNYEDALLRFIFETEHEDEEDEIFTERICHSQSSKDLSKFLSQNFVFLSFVFGIIAYVWNTSKVNSNEQKEENEEMPLQELEVKWPRDRIQIFTDILKGKQTSEDIHFLFSGPSKYDIRKPIKHFQDEPSVSEYISGKIFLNDFYNMYFAIGTAGVFRDEIGFDDLAAIGTHVRSRLIFDLCNLCLRTQQELAFHLNDNTPCCQDDIIEMRNFVEFNKCTISDKWEVYPFSAVKLQYKNEEKTMTNEIFYWHSEPLVMIIKDVDGPKRFLMLQLSNLAEIQKDDYLEFQDLSNVKGESVWDQKQLSIVFAKPTNLSQTSLLEPITETTSTSELTPVQKKSRFNLAF